MIINNLSFAFHRRYATVYGILGEITTFFEAALQKSVLPQQKRKENSL